MATSMVNQQSRAAEGSESKITNVDELLYAALLKYKPAWEEKNIDLVGTFAVDAFASVDSVRTGHVLDWMLSSAISRTPYGGEVFVCLETDDAWVRISVSDNGEKLPGEEQIPDMISFGSSHEYRNVLTMQLPRVRR